MIENLHANVVVICFLSLEHNVYSALRIDLQCYWIHGMVLARTLHGYTQRMDSQCLALWLNTIVVACWRVGVLACWRVSVYSWSVE